MLHGRTLLAGIALTMLGTALIAAPLPEPASGGISVADAWIPQPPPGTEVAAAYFTLRNGSHAPVTLIEVRSPLAAMTMLHRTTITNGISHMQMLDRLTVKPGHTVRLHPGGLHVMLESISKPLVPGDRVPLVLRFASGLQIQVSALVRPIGSE